MGQALSPRARMAIMRNNLANFALFLVLAAVTTLAWWYIDKHFLPKPEWKPPRETIQALAGAMIGPSLPATAWPVTSRLPVAANAVSEPPPVRGAMPAEPEPQQPPELIPLGDDSCFTKVLLTTQGGAVQQLILTQFAEANRLGREVVRVDDKGQAILGGDGRPQPQPLRLIPGIVRAPDPHSIVTEAPFPNLQPGPVTDPEIRKLLAEPSYQLLHYPSSDDPQRQPDDAGYMNIHHPSPELGRRHWQVVEREQPADGRGQWRVVFETELAAPYFLKLRKTYTLGAKDYHFGLVVQVIPLPNRIKGTGKFRYQIVGGRGLPIEGEWYTSVYRNVMIGWTNPQGGMKRSIEDAATIALQKGGERINRLDNRFAYAAVANQYFASALCLDDTMPESERKKIWDYVRPTREIHPWDDPSRAFLSDVTFRAVSTELNPGSDPENETITHKYLVYDGPVKVVQLGMLRGEREVSEELVTRYLDRLNLRTLTDYHSPLIFGRLANWLYWSDLVIFMTNIMHRVLYWLNGLIPIWGLNIVMLTVIVRMLLFVPSRKQQQSVMRLQEKMARLKPEIDKLQAQYQDDFHGFNQAKTKLMLENGVNPLATSGGCLLLFAQMPILMGLYFCLQESIFFRLEPFLWIPNLAAPDMLLWWSEKIPLISDPDNLRTSDNLIAAMFRLLYLGPYLNILPILAVAVIFMHQKISMPPATDEFQERQQRMMKFMVVFMGIFFYKVAAGLCIYFICSTAWALAERKLIPKPKLDPDTDPARMSGSAGNIQTKPSLMSKWIAKIEELQKQAEEQSQRQIRNPAGYQSPQVPRGTRDKKKRKGR